MKKIYFLTILVAAYIPTAEAITPYTGARLGWSYYEGGCESWASGCDRNALGAGLLGGLEFYNWLALEVGYTWLGKARGEYNAGNVDGIIKSADFSTKLSYSLADHIALYGRLGGIHWWGKVEGENYYQSGQGWDALFATGLEYSLNKRWHARVEYQYIDGLGNDQLGKSDNHLTSFSIIYRFLPDIDYPRQTTVLPIPAPSPTLSVSASAIRSKALSSEALFDFDSAILRDTAPLQSLLSHLHQSEQSRLVITGYTDNQGSAAYNQHLSQQRADAVFNWLISQGVSSSRLESRGLGEHHPIASNITEEGRKLNRRVVLDWQP